MLMSIAGVGIPANLMTASVILSTPSMRKKPFNLFILHQSFVDFIACLVTFFLQIFNDINAIGNSVAADVFCRIWVATSLMWITILASTYNLIFMTIERHQAVTRPLQYDESKVRRRLPIFCIMVWVIAFAIFSPDIIFSRIVEGECRANIDIGPSLYKFFFYFWMCTNVILPTIIMLSCYAHMMLYLRKTSQKFQTKSSDAEPDKRQQYLKSAQNNVLQTGFILVAMYVICWSYLTLIDAFIVYKVLGNFSSIEWNMALALVLGNSCINPFIYSFRYHEFQVGLKNIVFKCIRRPVSDA